MDLARAVHLLALCCETEGRGIVRLPNVKGLDREVAGVASFATTFGKTFYYFYFIFFIFSKSAGNSGNLNLTY